MRRNDYCSLSFRSHVHRDLNLQACCLRIQRNAALKQPSVGNKMQFSKGDWGENNLSDREAKLFDCGFNPSLRWHCDAGTGMIFVENQNFMNKFIQQNQEMISAES